MSTHNDIGKKGEDLARLFLEQKGYKILQQNWRYSKAEVDLVAMDKDVLVFVEVKTRSYDFYGPPEDFITAKKQLLLTLAASAYMQKFEHDWEIRFDVISIIMGKNKQNDIRHIQDAFFRGL